MELEVDLAHVLAQAIGDEHAWLMEAESQHHLSRHALEVLAWRHWIEWADGRAVLMDEGKGTEGGWETAVNAKPLA